MGGSHVRHHRSPAIALVGLLVFVCALGVRGPAPAVGATPVLIGIAGGINSAALPLFYAADKGIFAKYGLQPKLQSLSNDTLAIRGLVARSYDLIFVGAGTAIVAVGQGAKIKMVVMPAPHLDFYFLATKKVTSLKDMEGKTLGVSAPGALSANVALAVLRKHGVDVSKVHVAAVGSDPVRATALLAGTIDGGVVNTLIAVATLAKSNDIHILADAGAELGDDYLNSVVAARDDTIQSDPQMVQNAVTAIIEATRTLQSNRSAFVSFVKSQPSLPESAADKTFDLFSKRSTPWYGVDGGLDSRKAFDSTVQSFLKSGQLKTPVTWDEVFDTRFVEQALKQLGPYNKP
jgi:NitT/TauT family transport system substrate-binding protein